MPHRIKDGTPFPMPCPTCQAVAGMPFMAGTDAQSGGVRVAMRCRDCSHEWSFDLPSAVQPIEPLLGERRASPREDGS
jgi:hypothetical protein